ncbi:threonylcarbamoyl-AMP synthase [Anthonomus grandis grandis]|uniref:threonylcarbamoyl-AMP synthase n=1 Tax=Anthonomus grandis grandis TaxID=2921223 RepID=UPI0021655967|nr:threonylcarbamoyl-AMP synthase [Anthonomus grandis grandis]
MSHKIFQNLKCSNLNVYSMAKHIDLNSKGALATGIEFLKSGSVIAVPTDTIYGLTCDATNTSALHKLYNIKCRNEHKPVAICLGEISEVKLWANIKHLPSELLSHLLPGPITLILNGINTLDNSVCCKGKVGIRIPNYKFVRNLTKGLGKPLALTSANLSGQPSAIHPEEFRTIWNKIPAIFHGGVTNLSRNGSTIVDLSEKGVYQIIRRGVAFDETLTILQKFNLKDKYE